MKVYRDHFFLKAKKEQYPARSVYKLKEIDKKYKLLAKGMKVLDLGAAPGSWSLGAAEKVGETGLVVAVDIQTTETHFPFNVRFYQEDVFDRTPEFELVLQQHAPFHVVISDMAPKTTGTRFTDQTRSYELCEEALAVACKYLAKGGMFVVKNFMGPDSEYLIKHMRQHFNKVSAFKPQSSRQESKETFFIGIGFKGVLPEKEPCAEEYLEEGPSDTI